MLYYGIMGFIFEYIFVLYVLKFYLSNYIDLIFIFFLFPEPQIEFVTNKRGNLLIYIDEYEFQKKESLKEKTYYACSQRKKFK